jgi:hypothetical protein
MNNFQNGVTILISFMPQFSIQLITLSEYQFRLSRFKLSTFLKARFYRFEAGSGDETKEQHRSRSPSLRRNDAFVIQVPLHV